MENIKLTIAIPTFNRCELLRLTLESVLQQRVECMEIIVSDNASTDGTENMMIEFCNNYDIRYIRNESNLGMDNNFLNCLLVARGEYVHMLSDDDILLPGAVEKIMSIIDKESPDYINLNSFTYSSDKFVLEQKKPPRICIHEDVITKDKNRIMELLGVYITYISATIIKRSNLSKIENPQKYCGTYFLHAHLVLDMLMSENSKVVITKDAYLAAKNNNSGGFNLYEVWIKQYKKLLLNTAVRNGFDYNLMKDIYINDVNGFICDSILKYRVEHSRYDMKRTWILFRYTYMYPSIWIHVYKYAVLPKFILNIIYAKKRRRRAK